MTKKMNDILNNCFDARIRELNQVNAVICDELIVAKNNEEIKDIQNIKEVQSNFGIFGKLD